MFGLGKRGRARAVKRILIVEDEPLVAFDNEHVLAEAGFVVVATIDTAEEAARLIAEGGIDLVTSDVRLSGTGSGIDVARAAHRAGIPLLFVTGNCPAEAQALAAGCLAKPYSARDLVAAIAAIASHVGGIPPPRLPRGLTLFPV